jgi:membrane-anchored glycerophosphoryl diester phosphodiesterase (GDPDase)
MAKLEPKIVARAKPTLSKAKAESLPFTRKNYYILLAGLVVIILGYISLAMGSITLAPILLVTGYCVIVPVAILYRGRDLSATEQGVPGE